MSPEFQGFPKISRLRRNVIITEKLDGTNAQIYITDDLQLYAGSRNRWITPEDDNYGFAGWADRNKDQLLLLGPGRHFGEWWGNGIQRKYDLAEKRFSLFNVGRWNNHNPPPACCHVVPVLCGGPLSDAIVESALSSLRRNGSQAAPGFMDPEGVVVYHTASQQLSKITLKHDDVPKRCQEAA